MYKYSGTFNNSKSIGPCLFVYSKHLTEKNNFSVNLLNSISAQPVQNEKSYGPKLGPTSLNCINIFCFLSYRYQKPTLITFLINVHSLMF